MPTTLNAGACAPLGVATFGADTGGPIAVIAFTFAKPAATAAAAAIPPKAGPTTGIPANEA